MEENDKIIIGKDPLEELTEAEFNKLIANGIRTNNRLVEELNAESNQLYGLYCEKEEDKGSGELILKYYKQGDQIFYKHTPRKCGFK